MKNKNKLEKQRKNAREYRRTLKGRAAVLHWKAKYRAKKKDLLFNLSTNWICEGLVAKCPYFNVDFVLDKSPPAGHAAHPFAPTIDRIDPKKGYTEDNCQIISYQANTMKGVLTQSQLIESCKRIVENCANDNFSTESTT